MAEVAWGWWAFWMVVVPVLAVSWFWEPSYARLLNRSIEKTAARLDKEIYAEVLFHLLRDLRVEAAEIQLHVKAGQVALSGWVANRAVKKEAERIAERVAGVKDIHNQLKLKELLTSEVVSTDEFSDRRKSA